MLTETPPDRGIIPGPQRGLSGVQSGLVRRGVECARRIRDLDVAQFLANAQRNQIFSTKPSRVDHVLWRSNIGDGPCGDLRVSSGLVYIQGRGGEKSSMHVISAENGTETATYTCDLGHFAVLKDRLAGIDDHGDLVFVESTTGREIARPALSVLSFVIAAGRAYCCSQQSVYVVDIRSGRSEEKHQLCKESRDHMQRVVVYRGTLCVGGFHTCELVAIDTESWKELWRLDAHRLRERLAESHWMFGPSVAGDLVWITLESWDHGRMQDSAQVGIDLRTGAVKHIWPSSSGELPVFVSRDALLKQTVRGLECHSLDSQEIAWVIDLEPDFIRHPAHECADSSNVYLTRGRHVVGADLSTGIVSGRFHADSNITTDPVVDNGVLFFGCENGDVYALA